MFKKKIKRFFLSILFAFSALAFSACDSGVPIVGISMASEDVVQVPFGNFSYDGIKVDVNYQNGNVIQIDLNEDMISLSERLKFYKMGEQDVEVSFRDKFYTTMKINVVYNTFKDIYKLDDLTVTYDGLPHSLSLNEELPEGATIQYPYGNTFSAAGVYEVVGVISKTGYESKSLKATLTINPAEHDTDSIVFNNARFVYNGEMKTVEATGVPEGVSVEYRTYDYDSGIRINKIVNVGKYKVEAQFTDSNTNYKKIEKKTAIVTVVKADYDMSAHVLKDVVKTYDGKKYVPELTDEDELPDFIDVDYEFYKNGVLVDDNTACGTYKIKAVFTVKDAGNYNPIEPVEATLKVEPVEVDIRNKVYFDGASWSYGDDPVSLDVVLSKDFPKAYETAYEYKLYKEDGTYYADGDYVYAGQYAIHCDFHSINENVVFIMDELNAYVTINPIYQSVVVDSLTVVNNVPHIVVKTTDTVPTIISDIEIDSIFFFASGTDTAVEIANLVPGTTYDYSVSLKYSNPNKANSIIVSDVNGEYTHPLV